MPRICVALQAETTEQTIRDVLDADMADLLELRLDYRIEKLDLERIRASTEKPLIATNRRKDQGGKAEEPEEERVRLLLEAVEAGFDYVDVAYTSENLEGIVKKVHENGAKIIVSYHDFEHPITPEEIKFRHSELSETGCDVVKIIGWANSYKDNLPYLEYNKRHPGNVSFGMGEMGTMSRILAPLSGALYTYASIETGKELAPGQISLAQLVEIYGSIKR